MVTITLYARQKKETEMYRTDFWTLWEKARVGWSERRASESVYYQVWNRSPVQVGCMRQVLRAGALGRPRGMGWGGRREGGSGWETHVNPWLIHVNVWQKPLQYYKVISLQLINEKKKKREREGNGNPLQCSCLENLRDRAAQWAAVYGVTQSWARLKRLSSSSSSKY